MWTKFKSKGVKVIGLAVSERVPNPSVKIKEFRKRHKLTYTIVSDETGKVSEGFGVESIPASFLIDKSGKYASPLESIDQMVSKLSAMVK